MATCYLIATLALVSSVMDDAAPTVIVVVGAPGTEEYAAEFEEAAGLWQQAAEEAGADWHCIGREQPGDAPLQEDKQQLEAILRTHGSDSPAELWLVFLGHGTFDGRQAKFNLRGPDISAHELAEWIQSCQRPLAIVNAASASGPFVNKLSGPRRVIVAATRSGHEHNYARFGKYLSRALALDGADLDKDGQTSLLEAFLVGSKQTAEYYDQESRLASEHALLDDNGDGKGTPADWFRGIRVNRVAEGGALPDGPFANQWCLVRNALERTMSAEVRRQRDALELQIEQLRQQKSQLAEDDYYARLEKLLLQLARLYETQQPAASPFAGEEGTIDDDLD
jgi:hypothetical protein